MADSKTNGVEPSKTIGPRPELRWLDLSLLIIDARYQREISDKGRAVIAKIVEQFAWSRFGTLLVAPADDDKYAIVDGQHRYRAALAHPSVKDVPCTIVQAPSIAEQARMFLAINGDRTALNAYQLHHAGVGAGAPDAVHLEAICSQVGLTIPRNTLAAPSWKPHHLRFPGTVLRLLHGHGDRPVLAGLRIALAVARRDGEALRMGVSRAVIDVVAAHPRLDQARLQAALLAKPIVRLEDQARKMVKTGGGTATGAIAALLVQAYNAGLAPVQQLPVPGAKAA